MDICFFSTGTWNPKKEKDIDVEQIEEVFKVNFFGTVNSIKAVEEHFKNKYKNIKICFFSTGTWNPKKEKDIDVDQIEDVFKVNFFGTVNTIKTVEKYFKDKQSGIITIVSSIAGYRGLPNSTGYGPSKSALNNLAESLYFDFKRSNVRICLVSPGFIKTPMTDKNDFKMPFLKTPEYAANKIYDGLINKKVFEIHFPKELTLTLKLLSFLPSKLYFSLVGKLTKYQKKN